MLVNAARRLNYRLAVIETIPAAGQWWLLPSLWVLLTRDAAILETPAIRDAARPEAAGSERVPLWTDDFTSVFHILKSGQGPQLDPGVAEADFAEATRLAERGDFTVLEMAAVSGHKTLQMLKRYTHLQAEKLAAKLG